MDAGCRRGQIPSKKLCTSCLELRTDVFMNCLCCRLEFHRVSGMGQDCPRTGCDRILDHATYHSSNESSRRELPNAHRLVQATMYYARVASPIYARCRHAALASTKLGHEPLIAHSPPLGVKSFTVQLGAKKAGARHDKQHRTATTMDRTFRVAEIVVAETSHTHTFHYNAMHKRIRSLPTRPWIRTLHTAHMSVVTRGARKT